jgi:hypothetical protein
MDALKNITVAIHQPNFLPWLGYFDKIVNSDVFVFLDDAQIPKKGASWSNRVRVLIGGRPQWISVPISRVDGYQLLKDVTFNNSNWKKTVENTILMAYSRSSHFDETLPLLKDIFMFETSRLCEWNINSVTKILQHLQVPLPDICISSDLEVKSSSTERLCDLIKVLQGTEYLCGGGSAGYLDPNVFAAANIELRFQNFEETEYPQLNTPDFHHGLSIIDSLMMLGSKGTRALIETEKHE